MSDLLPCPFCGGSAYDDQGTLRTFGKRTGHEWAVTCRWCEASSPGDDDLGLAIATWNTRAPSQAQEAALTDTMPGIAEAFPDKLQIFRRDRKMTFGDHVDHDPNDWQAYIRADDVQAQIDAAVQAERERCAKVVEACLDSLWGTWVAKVIRKGDQP